MKKVLFIGGMSKLDLITYVGYLVQESGALEESKCLIVDFTKMQKARYLIPSVELPDKMPEKYITTYQKVDVAVGYNTYNELIEGGVFKETGEPYSFILFDIDKIDSLNSIPITQEDNVFLTTTFDVYSLEVAVELFKNSNIQVPVDMIFFENKLKQTHYDYLNYLFKDTKITWGKYIGELPFDNGDLTVIYANQRAGRMNVRNFSKKFRKELIQLTSYIAGTSGGKIRKMMDNLVKS